MFHDNILLVDLEMSSCDPHSCDPIEIGAVLLDKNTLDIIDEYTSLIKPDKGTWDYDAELVHGKTHDYLMKAGRNKCEVFKEFEKIFDMNNVRLACWNIFDIEILRQHLSTGIGNTHKIIELWSYSYPYLLISGTIPSRENIHGLQFFLEHFKIFRSSPHDALSDVRAEAKVFKEVTRYYNSIFVTKFFDSI